MSPTKTDAPHHTHDKDAVERAIELSKGDRTVSWARALRPTQRMRWSALVKQGTQTS